MSSEKTITYTYKLLMNGNLLREIPIKLDAKSLKLMIKHSGALPSWTELSCYQCPNCPFNEVQTFHCPVAANISELTTAFSNLVSHQEVEVHVESEQRTYVVKTHLQNALSSILGIFMTCSGCPILDKLRPMVRFHLPFPSYEETSYRALSMYLILQYFRYKEDKTPDWDLNGFIDMYQEIQKVNRHFGSRLREITQTDANNNALVILDCFASMIMLSAEIKQVIPDEIKAFFEPLLEDESYFKKT